MHWRIGFQRFTSVAAELRLTADISALQEAGLAFASTISLSWADKCAFHVRLLGPIIRLLGPIIRYNR